MHNTSGDEGERREPVTVWEHVRRYYEKLYGGTIRPPEAMVRSGERLCTLGYAEEVLWTLWDFPWERSHPCGCPVYIIPHGPHDRILNLGCGIGLDSIYLVRVAHQTPLVIGLDVVPSVLRDASLWAQHHLRVEEHSALFWVCGDALALPFRDQSFRAVSMNGVFNLFEDKRTLLQEAARVLRDDGVLVVADLIAVKELPLSLQEEWDGWVWCMSGALSEASLHTLARETGFAPPRLHEAHEVDDYFARALIALHRSSR